MLTAAELQFSTMPVKLNDCRHARGSYLAWARTQRREFTAEDVAQVFGVSRQVAACRLSFMASMGYITKVSQTRRGGAVWRYVHG